MYKAYVETRSYEWEAYANTRKGALNALRQVWRIHVKNLHDVYGRLMSEAEFIEDANILEIPGAAIDRRVGYCDREIYWVARSKEVECEGL